MPIYTYACAGCSVEIERRQSFSESPLTTCETCGGALRKVLHPVGVIFKGSGFYNTDYKKSSTSAANGSGSSESGKDSPAPKTDKSESTAGKNGASAPSSTPASSTSSSSAPASSSAA